MIDGYAFLPEQTRQMLAEYWPKLSAAQRKELQNLITDELQNDVILEKQLLEELQHAENGVKRNIRNAAEQQDIDTAMHINFDAL